MARESVTFVRITANEEGTERESHRSRFHLRVIISAFRAAARESSFHILVPCTPFLSSLSSDIDSVKNNLADAPRSARRYFRFLVLDRPAIIATAPRLLGQATTSVRVVRTRLFLYIHSFSWRWLVGSADVAAAAAAARRCVR